MLSRRRLLALASSLTISAVAAACSSDSDGGSADPSTSPTAPDDAAATTPNSAADTTPAETTTTTAAPTTTTLAVEELAVTYAEPGPYPVGVTTLQLAKGPKVEVWYPAAAGTTGEDTYDVRDFTPEAIRGLLTADLPASFTSPAARDAAGDGEAFPVVLFSHGFAGIRVQSTFLTAHLASWGYVVAAPDHPPRELASALTGATGDRADAVDDLLKTLELVIEQGATAGSLLEGAVDTASVIAVGHSAGGGTVLGAAEDPRITGYVSMASGAATGGTDTTGATTTLPTLPAKPSFFLAGALDAVISPERTRQAYELAPSDSVLWIIDGVGHNGFDDFCTLGGGSGIIGIAEASGLGDFLDAQPQFRSLGEDGCLPPAVPVEDTFPLIRHAVTSWIRWQSGVDAEPIGLGEVGDAYPVAVEIAVSIAD
jgi:dienelactone hydrolase